MNVNFRGTNTGIGGIIDVGELERAEIISIFPQMERPTQPVTTRIITIPRAGRGPAIAPVRVY